MRRAWLVAFAIFAGCGGDDSQGQPADDAGVRPDSTMPVGDAGSGADASSSQDAAREGGPPPCGSSAWVTYGHDPARTFASDGCVAAPLSVKWHYAPAPAMNKTFEAAFRAVAQPDAVFLAWMESSPPYTGTTAADRIDASGKRLWTFDSGTDTNLGNWPSLFSTFLAVNDDGLYLLNVSDGKSAHSTGVDWWGQTAPDPARLYVVNQMQADGPGLFVGAVDATAKTLWRQNVHEMCGHGWGDVMGGMAVDGAVVFYAPSYATGSGADPGFPSGVFAFDGATGNPAWSKTTKPKSAISAGDGRVYLIEDPNTLVARSQKDGSIAWSKPLAPATAGVQAPVLANGLAIVATSTGLLAFHADTGAPAWTSSVVAPATSFAGVISNGCGGSIAMGGAYVTTMAASLASGMLVVTASDGIHLVSLATGTDTTTFKVDAGFAAMHDPVVVGKDLYIVDATGVLALTSP